MKRSKQRSLQDVAREVLAEPYVPGQHKVSSYLEKWLDPSQRGGMLRNMSEGYFIGSLEGHSIDELEVYLQQFIVDARKVGKELAAERLYLRLMPPSLTNGGPPLED